MKYRILVVCEGEVTEPTYLKRFQHDARNQRVHVQLADESGVPMTVVKTAVRLLKEAAAEAKRARDDNLVFDSVWAVFDEDEHPNLTEACDLARHNGIEVALSSPCFELWALLHFQDQRAHVERGAVASMLRGHIPGYAKLLPYERLQPGYEAALSRAQQLEAEAMRHGSVHRNPSTTVHWLTELIRTK